MKRLLFVLALVGTLVAAGAVAAAATTKNGTRHAASHKTIYVRGPRGARGPRGPRGGIGPTGPQGPAGQNALANATVVSTTTAEPSASTTPVTLTATCPSGERAVGGGATSSDNSSSSVFIDETYPDSITNNVAQAWTSVVVNGSGSSVNFTVYAICA